MPDEIITETEAEHERALAAIGWMSGKELARRTWEELERARTLNDAFGKRGLTGITSGFADLDLLTSGWHAGDLIVVAGRPSIGKTTMALHMAVSAAKTGASTAFVSMEMTPTACVTRMIAAMGPQDERPLRAGYATVTEYSRVASTLERLGGYKSVWKDGTRLTLEELKGQIRYLQQREECRLLVLDQLGNLVPPNPRENRTAQVSALAAGLKSIAQEFSIPILATHQLNRVPEDQKDRRPEVWHLRDSGVVEQEADIVMLLHRIWTPSAEKPSGPVEVNVAKNRRGLMPTLTFEYEAPQTHFTEADL